MASELFFFLPSSESTFASPEGSLHIDKIIKIITKDNHYHELVFSTIYFLYSA